MLFGAARSRAGANLAPGYRPDLAVLYF